MFAITTKKKKKNSQPDSLNPSPLSSFEVLSQLCTLAPVEDEEALFSQLAFTTDLTEQQKS